MGVWIFKGQSKCGEGFVETETKKKNTIASQAWTEKINE